jgi:hypothetical protein
MSGFRVRDASFARTKALPNGAATTTTDAIDLDAGGSRADFVANTELQINAPALGTSPMPDAKTMSYDVIHSDNSDLSSPTVIGGAVVLQTGASGAGAAAATGRFRFPTNVKRYVGVRAVGSTTGNASGSSFSTDLYF